MKAFLHNRYGDPKEVMELREVDTPAPQAGQILVRIHSASVNAYDWHLIAADPFLVRIGGMGLLKPKYRRTGADFAGVVESLDPGVTQFSVGDHVFGTLSPLHDGAFAEYAVASTKYLAKMPSNASFAQAAAIPMAGLTALQGLRDVGKLRAGQNVAINGASGGVGTYAMQFARWLGGEVTAICSTGKVDLAKSLGADHVIDYTKEDFTKNGERYDLILGVNGYQRLKDYRRALTPNGTYVFAGGTNKQIFQGMLRVPLMNLRSSESLLAVGEKPNAADLQLVAGLVESGTVRSVIDRSYRFEEAPQAVAYVQEGHAAGKVIVEVRPE